MENKQDKGFTLVELLIVIVILGILATVTVFAVRGITSQGQDSACAADEKTLQTATEAYFAQVGGDTIVAAVPVDAAGAVMTDAAGDPLPASVQGALVTEGLMVDLSTTHDVTADGVVSFVAGGDCDPA